MGFSKNIFSYCDYVAVLDVEVHGYHMDITMVSHGYHNGISRISQGIAGY
jgi:hypothetical protein